eukprot:3217989-Rhodomonas_salina.1
MVEEAHAVVALDQVVLVARVGHAPILHGATGLDNILDAVLGAHVDGIAEGEESIRRDGHALKFLHVLLVVRGGQRLRHDLELLGPGLALDVRHVALDVAHTRVNASLALHVRLELQPEHLR